MPVHPFQAVAQDQLPAGLVHMKTGFFFTPLTFLRNVQQLSPRDN
jgi:hypothetical protein